MLTILCIVWQKFQIFLDRGDMKGENKNYTVFFLQDFFL